MGRTTLMACDFGYGGASFQLAIARSQLQKLPYTCNSSFRPDKSCKLPAYIFDQVGRSLDETGRMPVLHLWRPVEAESISALYSHIHKLPNKFLAFACRPSVWR